MTYVYIETFLGRGYRLQVSLETRMDPMRPYHAMVTAGVADTAHHHLGTTFERALVGLDHYLESLTPQHGASHE